jgi:F-type H+/Na+-transporting ATPase subunit alpha
VDIGRSVSRVGGKAQLPAFRAVAGDLRLSHAQFEELEAFSRFGTQLDKDTRQTIERGRRVRETLKQPQYRPLSAADQIGVLLAVTEGALDDLSPDHVARAEQAIRAAAAEQQPEVYQRIHAGESLSEADQEALLESIEEAVASMAEGNHGND